MRDDNTRENTFSMKMFSKKVIFVFLFFEFVLNLNEIKAEVNEIPENRDKIRFLGKEEEQQFEELSPEVSKQRLSVIVDKMDVNSDEKISEEELKQWIEKTQKKYISDDTERQWKSSFGENSGQLSLIWEKYREKHYGFLGEKTEESKALNQMLKRDEKRWKMADKDGNGNLDKEEFRDFLHPEHAPHMREVVVDETLEDIDKDKDGVVSEEEYIRDMYSVGDSDEQQIPDWVQREKQDFRQFRDLDKNGVLSREELREWLSPQDFDQSLSEARHLLLETDLNRDGFLSKEEIVNNYDTFVGSQVTDFGEQLLRPHDEL